MKNFGKKYRSAISGLLLPAVLLLSAPASTSCAAAPMTITMSVEDFNLLEKNYTILQAALDESLQALTEARQLLTASDEDLAALQESLTSSKQKIAQLQTELQTQKDMSKLLSSELTQLQTESETLQEQLVKAERYLNATEEAYQKERKINKRQTRLWQVISFIAAGIAATR